MYTRLALLLLVHTLANSEPLFQYGIGSPNIIKGKKSALFQFEYRSPSEIYRRAYFWIRPELGAFITTNHSFYLFGGLAFDCFLGKSLVFTPTFSPGFYYKGAGKNLGSALEFRSSVELSWQFENRMRLGAQFYHLSNGSLAVKNPGTEALIIFLGIPIN